MNKKLSIEDYYFLLKSLEEFNITYSQLLECLTTESPRTFQECTALKHLELGMSHYLDSLRELENYKLIQESKDKTK